MANKATIQTPPGFSVGANVGKDKELGQTDLKVRRQFAGTGDRFNLRGASRRTVDGSPLSAVPGKGKSK